MNVSTALLSSIDSWDTYVQGTKNPTPLPLFSSFVLARQNSKTCSVQLYAYSTTRAEHRWKANTHPDDSFHFKLLVMNIEEFRLL